MLRVGKVSGFGRKLCGRDKKTFFYSGRAHHGSGKFLQFWFAYGNIRFPTLGLNVDQIKTKLVFMNDSIDSVVAAVFGDKAFAVVHGFH